MSTLRERIKQKRAAEEARGKIVAGKKAQIEAGAPQREAERNARLARQKALQDQRQKKYSSRTGSTYKTPEQTQNRLERIRKIQERSGKLGDSTQGPKQAPNSSAGSGTSTPKPKGPVGVAQEATANAREGARAAAEGTGQSPKNPSIQQRTSKVLTQAQQKIEGARNTNAWQKSKATAGKVGRAATNTAIKGGKLVGGGVKYGWKSATNPYLLGATAASYSYNAGQSDMEARDQQLAAAQPTLGSINPSRAAVQPPLDETGVNERNYIMADNLISEAKDSIAPWLEAGYQMARGTYVPGVDTQIPYRPTRSDELSAEAEAQKGQLWTEARKRTGPLQETSAAYNDLITMQNRAAGTEAWKKLNDPNLPPTERIALVREITSELKAEGVPAEAVVDILKSEMIQPEVIQSIMAQYGQDPDLVAYDEYGRPEGRYTRDDMLNYREPENPLPASMSEGEPLQVNDQANTFTDINMPWRTNRIGKNGPVVTRDEQQRNIDAGIRQQIFDTTQDMPTDQSYRQQDYNRFTDTVDQMENTQGITTLGNNDANLEYAEWLRDPRTSSELSAKARLMELNRIVPGMKMAALAELPLRERVARIGEMRNEAQQRINEEIGTPGWRRRVEQRADPTGTLRKNAKLYSSRSGDYQDALSAAEETMRKELEDKYMPKVPESMEDNTFETEERADRSATNTAIADFRNSITNVAGDNVDAARSIQSLARKLGIEEAVGDGSMTPQQAESDITQLYAMDQLFKKFRTATGQTVGFDIENIYRKDGINGVQELMAKQFVEGGGAFSFRNPDLSRILESSDRGAIWDRVMQLIPGFSDDQIGTMILEGPDNNTMTVKELLGDDPFMYQMFVDSLRTAAENK